MQKAAFRRIEDAAEQARSQNDGKHGKKQSKLFQKSVQNGIAERTIIEGKIAINEPFQLIFERDPVKFGKRIEVFLQVF